MTEHRFAFVGGSTGTWQVATMAAVTGEGLEPVQRLDIINGPVQAVPAGARWVLRGVTSAERYTTRGERDLLRAKQPDLGRPSALCAALIPIRKSTSWWALAQDDRRAVFEEQSEHIKTGLRYLPPVARRLHHSRDLGEPFDFLTWFEYAPSDAAAFEELVVVLRRSVEWQYVEREVDIRLVRNVAA